MRTGIYVKELIRRGLYRRRGRRLAYVQRKTYEKHQDRNSITYTDQINKEEVVEHTVPVRIGREEEERLIKGVSERSRHFTRMSRMCIRITTRIVYRTRGPGRFRHELRKRVCRLYVINSGRSRGIWKWYESDVDLTRSDRRRSRFRFIFRVYRRFIYVNSVNQMKTNDAISNSILTISNTWHKSGRREMRKLMIWFGRVLWVWRVDERRDLGSRRSMTRLRCGYRRCIERWILRRYRRKGRKLNKNI